MNTKHYELDVTLETEEKDELAQSEGNTHTTNTKRGWVTSETINDP